MPLRRYLDESELQAQDGYLARRAGPGDKSIDKLDKEPPPDTVLARFGMLLVPANEDKNVPDIALAYDANEPPPVREGATGGSEDEAAYIRRPGQSPSGRPGSREARLGNRPGSEARRARVPTSGPGAASLGGATTDSPMRRPSDDTPQVVHKPSQKYPMWTA